MEPGIIENIKTSVESGKDIRLLLGMVDYASVREDSHVRDSYETLIKKGLIVGFNPEISDQEHSFFVNDQLDVLYENKETGEGFYHKNNIFSRKQYINYFLRFQSDAICVENFNPTPEEMKSIFKSTPKPTEKTFM
jgi:hypothetical protein